MTKLQRSFFQRHTVDVAKDLIGKHLHFQDFSGIITETEAYRGTDDPASHAFKGPTPRSSIMFGPAGFSYIYLIYGMYHCFNITCENENEPGAVLIRGVQLTSPSLLLLNGPGKLCRHLIMTKKHHALDMTESLDFFISDQNIHPLDIQETSRIGIRQGIEKPWRFVGRF